LGEFFVLSLLSAFNPTLVAATTVMLLLPSPKRLMFGYLLGAMMTSITIGLVLVFAVPTAGATSTTQHSLSPAVDVAIGAIAIVIALVLRSGRDQRLAERRRKQNHDKQPPRWQRQLGKGSARATFVVGALLTLPGASYLAGIHRLKELHEPVVVKVLAIIGFNLVMLAILEVPLLCFLFAPDWTPGAVERVKAFVGRHARRVAVRGFLAIGILLVIKGVVGLLH